MTCNGHVFCEYFRYLNKELQRESQKRETNIQKLNIELQKQSKEIEKLENDVKKAHMTQPMEMIGNIDIYLILFNTF